MAKFQPSYVQGEVRLDDHRGLDEYVQDLTKQVRYASTARAEWMARKEHFYDRRYGRANRNVEVPWKGASDIVPPIIDTMMDELKPPLLNLMFGQPTIYTFLPMDASSVRTAGSATLAMDHLIKHRMPDYLYQKLLTIDSLGQWGLGTEKCIYSYITRQTTEVLTKAELPPELARMAVFKEVSQAEQMMAQQTGAVFLTRQQFDQVWDAQIKAMMLEWVGLDEDEKVDKVALADIRDWLRNGSKDAKITLKRRGVIEDTPRLINVPLEQIIAPCSTGNIRDAAFICHRMQMSENELKQRARDDVWDKAAVDAELSEKPTSDLALSDTDGILALARRERTNPGGTYGGEYEGKYEIWECCCEWDIDGDGLAERCVITHSPQTGKVFKAIPLPFDHGEWPYVDTLLEVTDNDRLAPRGIPELVDDMERHATALMRFEENALTIQTSPTFTYVENTVASLNPGTISWVPGLFIPQGAPGEVNALQIPVTALALESPLRTYLGMAERRVSGANIGVFDQKPPERRTKAEVEYFSSARQRVLGVRGRLFQEAQKRSGFLLWELFRQFGPKKFWVQVTGQPPVELTQAMVQGRFEVLPVGSVEDMDPDYRSQKSLQNLQILMQLAPVMGGDIRYQVDLGQAAVDYFDQCMPMARQRVIKDVPPEMQQQMLMQQQQQAAQMNAIAMEAQKAIQNAPLSDPKYLLTLLTEAKKSLPHKDLQNIIVQGQAAMTAAQTNAMRLASSNGNGARFS